MNTELEFMKLAVDQYTSIELDALNDNPSKLFCREPHRDVVANEYELYVKLQHGMTRPKELPASFAADTAMAHLVENDAKGFDLGMLRILVLIGFCGLLFFGGFFTGRMSTEKDTRTTPPQTIERPIIRESEPPKEAPVFVEPAVEKLYPITR